MPCSNGQFPTRGSRSDSLSFTDAAGQKRRPALVLLDTGDPDIVAARLTSQPYSTAFDISLISSPLN